MWTGFIDNMHYAITLSLFYRAETPIIIFKKKKQKEKSRLTVMLATVSPSTYSAIAADLD